MGQHTGLSIFVLNLKYQIFKKAFDMKLNLKFHLGGIKN